jgi:hypothetical protein
MCALVGLLCGTPCAVLHRFIKTNNFYILHPERYCLKNCPYPWLHIKLQWHSIKIDCNCNKLGNNIRRIYCCLFAALLCYFIKNHLCCDKPLWFSFCRAGESVQIFRLWWWLSSWWDNHDDEEDDDDNMLLPVLSISSCLLITKKAHCYVTNRLIYKDLEFPFFVDYSKVLTESFGSNLIQGISSATCKTIIPTKTCLSATVVQLAPRTCLYGFTVDRAVSVQHRLRWLNFSVIFLICKAYNFKGESPSFPNHCYLQPKLSRLNARVFSKNDYNIFYFNSRASTQPKAFLPKGINFQESQCTSSSSQ